MSGSRAVGFVLPLLMLLLASCSAERPSNDVCSNPTLQHGQPLQEGQNNHSPFFCPSQTRCVSDCSNECPGYGGQPDLIDTLDKTCFPLGPDDAHLCVEYRATGPGWEHFQGRQYGRLFCPVDGHHKCMTTCAQMDCGASPQATANGGMSACTPMCPGFTATHPDDNTCHAVDEDPDQCGQHPDQFSWFCPAHNECVSGCYSHECPGFELNPRQNSWDSRTRGDTCMQPAPETCATVNNYFCPWSSPSWLRGKCTGSCRECSGFTAFPDPVEGGPCREATREACTVRGSTDQPDPAYFCPVPGKEACVRSCSQTDFSAGQLPAGAGPPDEKQYQCPGHTANPWDDEAPAAAVPPVTQGLGFPCAEHGDCAAGLTCATPTGANLGTCAELQVEDTCDSIPGCAQCADQGPCTAPEAGHFLLDYPDLGITPTACIMPQEADCVDQPFNKVPKSYEELCPQGNTRGGEVFTDISIRCKACPAGQLPNAPGTAGCRDVDHDMCQVVGPENPEMCWASGEGYFCPSNGACVQACTKWDCPGFTAGPPEGYPNHGVCRPASEVACAVQGHQPKKFFCPSKNECVDSCNSHNCLEQSSKPSFDASNPPGFCIRSWSSQAASEDSQGTGAGTGAGDADVTGGDCEGRSMDDCASGALQGVCSWIVPTWNSGSCELPTSPEACEAHEWYCPTKNVCVSDCSSEQWTEGVQSYVCPGHAEPERGPLPPAPAARVCVLATPDICAAHNKNICSGDFDGDGTEEIRCVWGCDPYYCPGHSVVELVPLGSSVVQFCRPDNEAHCFHEHRAWCPSSESCVYSCSSSGDSATAAPTTLGEVGCEGFPKPPADRSVSSACEASSGEEEDDDAVDDVVDDDDDDAGAGHGAVEDSGQPIAGSGEMCCNIGTKMGADGKCHPDYSSCMQSCRENMTDGWRCSELADCDDDAATGSSTTDPTATAGSTSCHSSCPTVGATWMASINACVATYDGCLAACQTKRGPMFAWTCNYSPCADRRRGRKLSAVDCPDAK